MTKIPLSFLLTAIVISMLTINVIVLMFLIDFLEGLAEHIKNDRVTTFWLQMGTATGRLASANPNLQNIPNQEYIIEEAESQQSVSSF